MTELQPSDPIASVLKLYHEVGGVVEHVIVALDQPDLPESQQHRNAALFTLQTLQRRTDAYFETLLQTKKYRNRRREEFFQIRIQEELLTGRPVTVPEFLGPSWNPEQACFVPSDERTGYAAAFRDPPYPLRRSQVEALELFRAMTESLFAGFREPLAVYEWSTECSNYFDAGREWWGTFFWTVGVLGASSIVGVVASTTD